MDALKSLFEEEIDADIKESTADAEALRGPFYFLFYCLCCCHYLKNSMLIEKNITVLGKLIEAFLKKKS